MYRGRYWFPLWYDPEDDARGESGDDGDSYGDEQVLEEEGQLDQDGKLTISTRQTRMRERTSKISLLTSDALSVFMA